MKAARLYSRDDIRIEEIDAPEPDEGEILVQTRACGICTGDIMGWYMERKAPLVFGHEPSGVVAAVGAGVEELNVGDRVFVHHHAPCGRCRHCRRGAYVHCKTWRSTGLRPGGMAEYFAVPAANVAADTLRLPDSVSFEAGSLIEPTACVVSRSATPTFPEEWPFFQQPLERWLLHGEEAAAASATPAGFSQSLAMGTTWQQTLAQLAAQGMQRLVLLGGASLVASCLRDDAVDDLQLTLTPRVVGGEHSWVPFDAAGLPPAPASSDAWMLQGAERLQEDELVVRYQRRRSP